MKVGVVGDSHSVFCFAEMVEARIYWRGPTLMHRVARDGIDAILPRRFKASSFDALIFVFGEIDCRMHVTPVALKSGRSIEHVVDDLAARYIARVTHFRRTFCGAVSIMGVIPSAASMIPVARDETSAVARQRQVNIRRRLNARLKSLADANAIGFIDVHDAYADADGELQAQYWDGNVHIAPNQTRTIVDAAAASLNLPLTYRRLNQDVFLIPVGNYWKRRRELVNAWAKKRWRAVIGARS
jgi:hypothetical protein